VLLKNGDQLSGKPEEEKNISSAVDEIYAGLLVRFRDCMDKGGFESAEHFIKEVLPSLNLILARIDDELETSKKNYVKTETVQDHNETVDLEDVSNIISNLLTKIPPDETQLRVEADQISAVAGMERSPPLQRSDDIIQTTLLPLERKPPGQKAMSSLGSRSSAGAPQLSDHPPEYVNGIAKPSTELIPVNQYANTQSIHTRSVETVQVSQNTGEKINVTLPPAETTSVPQPTMETIPVNPAAPGDIPANSALTHVSQQGGMRGTPGGYYIKPVGNVAACEMPPEPRETTHENSMYSAEETYSSPAGGGRYSSEYDAGLDLFIPEETGKYTPRKMDIYLRYSNLHMEQGNYIEALKFIAMAKELPDYYEHEYYREEIMDLEDSIERNRYQGASTGGENAVDLKYTGFDYISQKGKTKAWHEEDDF
jgi:hypothetical protein